VRAISGEVQPTEKLILQLAGGFMLKRIFVPLLVLTLYATTVHADIKISKSEDKKLGTVLRVSNKYIDFTLCPDKGGAINSFKYLGTQFATAEGILNDHLWSQKMAGDFWKKQYSYRIKKGRGSVSIELNRAGETGIYQFLEIHKKITVTADSPVLKVAYTWLNRKNSMSKMKIKAWFHYLVMGPGKNQYYAPESTGIKQFDWNSGDPMTERWLYDCAAGWTGVVNPKSGKGIVFTPEYKYLQCFYNWKNRKISTLEWRNTPVTIECGKTFSTSFDMIPFNGLNAINGAGNGIVGELKTDSVRIFSSIPRKVNVTVIKSGGSILKKSTINLVPNKVTVLKFSKNLNALTCKIEKNGKLLTELKRGIPQAPLKFTWKPREKRYKEAQVALPWRFKLADKLDLPYIPFAKPWAGGRLKVFFLVDLRSIANVISMKERMDIESFYTTLPYKWWTTGWIQPQQMPTGWIQIADVVKKEAFKALPGDLQKAAPQVIVVGETSSLKYSRVHFGWNLLPPQIRKQVMKMVQNGTGLVIVGTNIRQGDWKDGLEDIYKKSQPAASVTSDPAIPAKYKKCARIAKYGKGTVVFLRYRANGLLPHMSFEQVENRLDETLFSMPVRAVLTAGNKNFSGGNAVKTEKLYLRGGIEYTKKPTIAGDYVAVKIARDNSGKVVDWSFDKLKVESPCRITSVKTSKECYGKDETVTVNVKLNAPGDTVELECFDNYGRLIKHLSDSANSNKKTYRFKVDNPLTVIYKLVVTLSQGNKVVSRETAKFYLPYVYETKPNFMFHVWGGTLQKLPEYYIGGFQDKVKNIGFESICEGTVWRIAETSKYNAAANFRVALINLSWTGVKPNIAADMNSRYKKTGDTKFLIRNPCMNNPQQRGAIEKKITRAASAAAQYGPMIYMLGDEMSLTTEGGATPLDICFSPYCLHKFQAELRKQFGAISKLNSAWGSSFKSFEQVKPLTLDQAIKQNKWASWLAHRQFMDTVYANYFKWTTNAIRRVNPKAMIGESGIHDKMSVYGGYAWPKRMKYEKVALFYGTGVLPMSFAERHKFNFSSWCLGYADEIAKDKFDLWQALFRGQNMISLFCSSILINPDMSLSYYGKSLKPIIQEALSGPGDALAAADKQTSPVAILISQKSLLISYIQKQQGVIDTYQLYRTGIDMWLNLLLKYGYSPYYVNAPQLTEGILEKRKCKTLILPMTYVLTPQEAEAVRRFVKNGGIVIADACTAIWNQYGQPLEKGRLDDVFGIKRNASKLVSASVGYNFQGNKIVASILEDGLILSSQAFASSSADSVDTFFGSISFGAKSGNNRMTVNKYGQGKAFYLGALGLKLDYPGGALPLTLLRQNGIEPFVEVTSTKGVSESENGTFKSGEITYYGVIDTNKRDKSKKSVRFANRGYVYGMRSGRDYGLTQKVALKSDGAKLFAVLPRRPAFKVFVPSEVKRGTAIKIKVTTNIKGKYPFHVKVVRPDGKVVKELVRNIFALVKHPVPFALNDLTGIWEIVVKDVITGKTTTTEIKVK
jgi:Beta-galactosidase trimerisation domain/Beta-galactosidase